MTTTWQEFRKKRSYPALEENIRADVCIVGGGMTGVLLAYRLAQEGKQVVLVEKRELGSYATAMTTAFITKVIDSPLTKIINNFGAPTGKTVWQSGQAAVDEFERIIIKEGIECEFARCSDCIYATSEEEYKELEKEYAAYRRLKIPAMLHPHSKALNFVNAGYLEIPSQAKVNQAKFLFALAERAERAGVIIFEHTEVLSIKSGKNIKIKAKHGTVTAEDVVVATYQPMGRKVTGLRKVMNRSYVLEVQIPRGLLHEGIYEDMAEPYHYFRIDRAVRRDDYDRMIVGGEDHPDVAQSTAATALSKVAFKALGTYLAKLMDSRRYWIVKKWSGPILESTDGLPRIGKTAPHQYVGSGFSGNGLTYAMITALLISDLIAKRKNVWAKAYDPARS